MILAIRDDDTSFFTKPEQLSNIYGNYWHICPITLSIIPFIDSSVKANPPVILVPERYQNESKKYPIGENIKLLKFLHGLIEKEYIGISLHGFSHERKRGKPEFVKGDNLYQKTKKGKRYLEEIFKCEIKVFVPPNNSLSAKGAKAVIDAGMDILIAYGFYPWERPISYQSFKNFLKLFKHYLRHKRHFPYPGLFNYKTHKEHACVNLGRETTFQELKDNFNFLREKNANMCLSVHYAALYYLPKTRKVFNDFMDYLISNFSQEIKFVTADKLFETENEK